MNQYQFYSDPLSMEETYIDPATTNEIINNLNIAIDEAKLIDTLDDMTTRIQQIEATKGSSKSSEKLRKEIRILEVQINYLRDRASFS